MSPVDETPIDVVAALKGSPYEDVAEKLDEEFARVRISIKSMVQNAPLKLKKTFGVDIYEVMQLILDYEEPKLAQKKTKKSS